MFLFWNFWKTLQMCVNPAKNWFLWFFKTFVPNPRIFNYMPVKVGNLVGDIWICYVDNLDLLFFKLIFQVKIHCMGAIIPSRICLWRCYYAKKHSILWRNYDILNFTTKCNEFWISFSSLTKRISAFWIFPSTVYYDELYVPIAL